MEPLRLPFTGPWLLAPMEGVTEPCFRELVLARNPAEVLGGAFTEFVRVLDHPLSRRVLRAHLGSVRFEAPVGLQVMGSDLVALEATAERVAEVGAALVDINFGCPAKGALRGCAGSAVLRDPRKLEQIVAACVRGVAGAIPVSAKIRAGDESADDVESIASAAEQGGAALLTVHCRTRREHYAREVDWTRIQRAVASVSIPVCGNGGIAVHADFERMRRETGCAYAMVGQGALADPWIFSGVRVSPAQAARFLLEYGQALRLRARLSPRSCAGRIKQLLRHWTAGDLLGHDRRSWLREPDPEELTRRLQEVLPSESPEGSPATARPPTMPRQNPDRTPHGTVDPQPKP